jgi:hypothetical protein
MRQRLVAFRVKVRIRLVEHDEERIAIERARQADGCDWPADRALP